MATLSTRLDTSVSALKSSEQQKGHFNNHEPVQLTGFGKTLKIFWKMLFQKPRSTRPVGEIPVQPLTLSNCLPPRPQRVSPGALHRPAENAR